MFDKSILPSEIFHMSPEFGLEFASVAYTEGELLNDIIDEIDGFSLVMSLINL